MATKPLEASVRQNGNIAVLELRGEIDSFGEEALNAAYAEAEERAPSAVLLNFAGVDYINSTGIAVIVGLIARARRDHCPLVCYGLSDHYRMIFEVTRLSDFMEIATDEDSAVAVTS